MPSGLIRLFTLQKQRHLLPDDPSLQQAGLDLLPCANAADLHARVNNRGEGLCALVLPPNDADMTLLVAMLQATTAGGIIALVPQNTAEHRIHALLMGADICVPAHVGARELAACVLTLTRRLGRPDTAGSVPTLASALEPMRPSEPATSDRPWQLANDDWDLISPQGVRIGLTRNERKLVMALAATTDTVHSREALAMALSDDALQIKPTSINMLVSRLRAKVRDAGAAFPLNMLSGRGYALSAALQRSGACVPSD